jgi:hypothetical protein
VTRSRDLPVQGTLQQQAPVIPRCALAHNVQESPKEQNVTPRMACHSSRDLPVQGTLRQHTSPLDEVPTSSSRGLPVYAPARHSSLRACAQRQGISLKCSTPHTPVTPRMACHSSRNPLVYAHPHVTPR